jgi:hypothetical protein
MIHFRTPVAAYLTCASSAESTELAVSSTDSFRLIPCDGAKVCGGIPNTFLNSRQKWASVAKFSSAAAALLEYPCEMSCLASRHWSSRSHWLGVRCKCLLKIRCRCRSDIEQSEAILAGLNSACIAICSQSFVRNAVPLMNRLSPSCRPVIHSATSVKSVSPQAHHAACFLRWSPGRKVLARLI